MADENIVTNIVANADFSNLIADVNRVAASLSKLQAQIIQSDAKLANQVSVMNRSFAENLRRTGQFSSHFVTLTSDVEKFGKNLDNGQLKLKNYFRTFQDHTKTSGGLIRDLAKQQVALQNAVVQPLGKNAQGLMQFNVHIPQGLDAVKNKTALARQELQIMNKVIQDGGVQLINWGKNTQWAGRQLTVGLTVPLAALGAAASKSFREADAELTRLTKVYGGVAASSAADLSKIRAEVSATARELSAAYGTSFKDTISLASDLAATGKQGNDLIEATRQTTRLAVLGEVDRQDAMKATLAIQNAFKQNTTELTQSIDFLNAVENQTSTSLGDLIEAIPKAGPVIQGLGGSVKDLALYLTAMKEGGINASEGANALKSALASLINPTKVAEERFAGFGINLRSIVEDNAGDLTGMILELQTALDALNPLQKSQAIEQLFGKFQFARMNALFANLGKQGSQTLQVMDLMKASSKELANVAGRELALVTESASGKYKRAVESLKANLAGIGEEFLKVQTFFINLTNSVITFIGNLPDPIKKILTFVTGITAAVGPIIMLTGVLANFFGYIIKGASHFRSMFKGGEGWKMLTPEILAAQKAGNLVEATFYNDAKAAAVLKTAITGLIQEFSILEAKAKTGATSLSPAFSSMAASVGSARQVNPNSPFISAEGTRAMSHMNPVAGMTTEQKASQTIFGVVPGAPKVNQKISNNPQMYVNGDIEDVSGLSSIRGASTGVVASEAAKFHAMNGAMAMQSQAEIKTLRAEIARTGLITSELSSSYQALLPTMTELTQNAAAQSANIVAQAKAGKISIDQARAQIIALNTQIEQMMGSAAINIAGQQGRAINLTNVPLLNQPVVDNAGKSNMKELFRPGRTSGVMSAIAKALGVKTNGAPYSTATTIPKRMAMGGSVPGTGNQDTVPAMLTPGEFVVNAKATKENLPLLKSMNGRGGMRTGYNLGGMVQGYNKGGLFLGMPRGIKAAMQQRNARLQMEEISAGVNASRFKDMDPTDFGTLVTATSGRSFPVPGIGGMYKKPDGTIVFVKPMMDEKAALAEQRATIIARDAHGLNSPNQQIRTMIDPTDPTGNRKLIVLESPFDEAFAKSSGKFTKKQYFRQLVAANLRGDRDLSPSNLYGNTLTDVGTAGVFKMASGKRDYESSMTSMLEQSRINLLGVKGGAKRFFAESTLDIPKGMTSDQYHKAMIDEIDTVLPKLTNTISKFKLNKEESAVYQAMIKRLEDGRQVNYREFHGMHSAVEVAKAKQLTPAALLKLKTEADLRMRQRGHSVSLSDNSFKNMATGFNTGGIVQAFMKMAKNGARRPMLSKNLIDKLFAGRLTSAAKAGFYEPKGNAGVFGGNVKNRKVTATTSKINKDMEGDGVDATTLLASINARGGGSRVSTDVFLDGLASSGLITKAEKRRLSRLIFTSYAQRLIGMGKVNDLNNPIYPVSNSLLMKEFSNNPTALAAWAKWSKSPGSFAHPTRRSSTGFLNKIEVDGQVIKFANLEGSKSNKFYHSKETSNPFTQLLNTTIDNNTPARPAISELTRNPLIPRAMEMYGSDMHGNGKSFVPLTKIFTRSPEGTGFSRLSSQIIEKSKKFGTGNTYTPGAYKGYYRRNAGGIIPGFNVGGTVPGTGNTDTVPAMLTPGEFVINKKATAENLPLLQTINGGNGSNTRKYSEGGPVSYFDKGGPVHGPEERPGFRSGFTQQSRRGFVGSGMIRRPAGGGLGMGAQMGLMMGGTMAGQAVGGNAGTGIMAAANILPLLPLQKIIPLVGKLMTSLKTLSGIASIAGKAMGLIFRLLPGTAVIGAIGLAVFAYKKWQKQIEETRREHVMLNGITEKGAAEAGISYKNVATSINDVREQFKLQQQQGISAYESFTGSGVQGLTLTIAQLKELKKTAKETMPELLGTFNGIDTSKVNDLAANLKAQFVSAGMSAQDATNKIYAIIEASNKAGAGLGAITSSGFTSIIDKGSAASAIVKNLIDSLGDIENIDPKAFASNIDTVITSLDAATAALVGTKDAQGNTIDQATAMTMQWEKLVGLGADYTQLGEKALSNLKKERPELAAILKSTDTVAGMYAKWRVLLAGVNIDLKNITSQQAMGIAAYEQALSMAADTAKSNSNTTGTLGAANILTNKLTEDIKKGESALKKYSNTEAGLSKARIKAIQDEIKAIRDRADEKKRALRSTVESENIELELQKLKLEAQSALARGDRDAYEAANIAISQLTKETQLKKAEDKVDSLAKKEEAAQQKILDADQARKDAASDAASVAQKNNVGKTDTLSQINSLKDSLAQLAIDQVEVDKLKDPKKKDEEQKAIDGRFQTIISGLEKASDVVQKAFPDFVDAKTNKGKLDTVIRGYNGTSMSETNVQGSASKAFDKLVIEISGGAAKNFEKLATSLKGGATLADVVKAMGGKIDKSKAINQSDITSAIIANQGKSSAFLTDQTKDDGSLEEGVRKAIIKKYGFKDGDSFTFQNKTYNVKNRGGILPGVNAVLQKAGGGPFAAGQTLMLNDRINPLGPQPEGIVMRPNFSGTIYPNAATMPRYNVASGEVTGMRGGVNSSYNNNNYSINIALNGTNVTADDVMRRFKSEMALVHAKEGRIKTVGGKG